MNRIVAASFYCRTEDACYPDTVLCVDAMGRMVYSETLHGHVDGWDMVYCPTSLSEPCSRYTLTHFYSIIKSHYAGAFIFCLYPYFVCQRIFYLQACAAGAPASHLAPPVHWQGLEEWSITLSESVIEASGEPGGRAPCLPIPSTPSMFLRLWSLHPALPAPPLAPRLQRRPPILRAEAQAHGMGSLGPGQAPRGKGQLL